MANIFVKEKNYYNHIYMKDVKDHTDMMELTEPLPCGEGEVPVGFRWNGSSSGPLRNFPIIGFPKWKHPIASCKHDYRCSMATNKEERKIADQLFYKDVEKKGTKWEQIKGYLGVRFGAIFLEDK